MKAERSKKIIQQKNGDVVVKTKIKADSNRFEIVGINPWRNHLEIKVKSRARKGAANRELVAELSSILKSDVSIISGEKSREKRLLVTDSTPDEIIQRLKIYD
ncbi:MAG: DUF167 domain-containing protein [Candidatus Hadarchaeia archaeon]